jgi:nicotinate dehydrogenase subunit B
MSTQKDKPWSADRASADESGGGRRQFAGEPEAPAIGDWLRFCSDGTVEVLSGKAEMGQGIRTSLAQAVAEELRLPLERVRTVLGDTAAAPYDMGTFGSRTTPVMASRLHKVAASARELFIERAACQWGIDRRDIVVANGAATDPATGRSLSYLELAGETDGGKLSEPWSEDAPVTPPERWTVAGKPARRRDGRDFVTGRHRYTWDLARPVMLVGAVLRRPAFGASIEALDKSAAEQMPGVIVVHEGEFVGVAAPDRGAAHRAIAAMQARWHTPDTSEQVSWRNVHEYFKTHLTEPQGNHRWGGPDVFETGSLEAGRNAATSASGHILQVGYTVPYIAHVPLETRAALAEWEGDNLTVWTGSQRPFGVRSELATAFGIREEQVRVIVPDTGSAYGGKHTGEAAIEAARLARAARRPVKLVWSREDEFTWAYFRPAGLIEISSAVAGDGRITAWDYRNYNSGAEAMRPPYTIPNQRVAFQTTLSPLRQGSYRALAATANHFARESHIDELANSLGMDPLDFRLRNLPNERDESQARLRAVLLAAAERFGWASRNASPGHGFGTSCGTEKGSYVATCAEVLVDRESGQVRVLRVVEAFECGAIVNPEGLTNQVEGAVVQALGGALFERIEFSEGKVLTDKLSRYRVPRFSDVPEIEVVLLDRKDLPSTGAGETPIVGLAPAVANAIFDATGRRLRDLPLTPGGSLMMRAGLTND